LKGKKKSWDEYLPHIRFSYNQVVHKTTNLSPFEFVYDFNPLTPFDLLPLPGTTSLFHEGGVSRAEFVKRYCEKVKDKIEKQTKKYVKDKNKERKKITFEEGDLVFLHLRKDRFLSHRKSKLNPRGHDPFQVLQKINDNAYRLDLLAYYGVSPTFNVCDLNLFVGTHSEKDNEEVELNMWTNPFQEGGPKGGPHRATQKGHSYKE